MSDLICEICAELTNACACGHRIPRPLEVPAAIQALSPAAALGGAEYPFGTAIFYRPEIEGACTSLKRGNAAQKTKFPTRAAAGLHSAGSQEPTNEAFDRLTAGQSSLASRGAA